jgi:hypothetical protein
VGDCAVRGRIDRRTCVVASAYSLVVGSAPSLTARVVSRPGAVPVWWRRLAWLSKWLFVRLGKVLEIYARFACRRARSRQELCQQEQFGSLEVFCPWRSFALPARRPPTIRATSLARLVSRVAWACRRQLLAPRHCRSRALAQVSRLASQGPASQGSAAVSRVPATRSVALAEAPQAVLALRDSAGQPACWVQRAEQVRPACRASALALAARWLGPRAQPAA